MEITMKKKTKKKKGEPNFFRVRDSDDNSNKDFDNLDDAIDGLSLNGDLCKDKSKAQIKEEIKMMSKLSMELFRNELLPMQHKMIKKCLEASEEVPKGLKESFVKSSLVNLIVHQLIPFGLEGPDKLKEIFEDIHAALDQFDLIGMKKAADAKCKEMKENKSPSYIG